METYLALSLYCEFADKPPSSLIRNDQIAVFCNPRNGQLGSSILRLIKSGDTYVLYIYCTYEMYLDGRWVLRIQPVERGGSYNLERFPVRVPNQIYKVPHSAIDEAKAIIFRSKEMITET